MIEGSVDLLGFNRASGWASELPDNKCKLTVKALLDGQIIAQTIACLARKDLEFLGDQGKFAYELQYPVVKDMEKLKIIAESATGERELPVLKVQAVAYGYQTFHDQIGDSNSFEKLKCLGLPPSMAGLSVLDIGCNEGFFCIDAHARGAREVTGIDANQHYIEKARKRDPKTHYICGSWWDIPDKKYDFIYFLSAMHYEPEPARLLDKLAQHLTPGGKLILECGLSTHCENQTWTVVARGDGIFRYPSRHYLTNTLLKNYFPRFHSISITQPGDPVQRYVFHATLRQPVVIFLSGPTLSGKTILASLLENKKNVVSFSIDLWLWQLKVTNQPLPENNPIYQLIKTEFQALDIRKCIDGLNEEKCLLFADALFEALPLNCECIILEGYALENRGIAERLSSLLRQAGLRLWNLAPMDRPE